METIAAIIAVLTVLHIGCSIILWRKIGRLEREAKRIWEFNKALVAKLKERK